MATLSPSRFLLASGFALAVAAAPAVAAFTVPSGTPATTVAACPAGEEADPYTANCIPHTVPNSPVFSSPAGNPNIPEVQGVPCTGRNTGECIGLGEEQAAQGPQPVPESTVGSSPTVHGTA
jgi:hypothetical protein